MQTNSPSADASPTPQPPRRLSWNLVAVIVAVVLVIGAVLNVWRPLLLAPPNLEATLPLYAVCGLAWLPVLVLCLLLRPTGRRAIPILLLVVGLILFCVTLALGPAIPMGGALGAPLQCEVVSQTPERIRYECVADRMFMTDTYVFEGPTGLPVVWLVSQSSVSY